MRADSELASLPHTIPVGHGLSQQDLSLWSLRELWEPVLDLVQKSLQGSIGWDAAQLVELAWHTQSPVPFLLPYKLNVTVHACNPLIRG